MQEKCEQFFLRGVDVDRAWGPFARWRPARNERITFRLALAALLPFTLLTPLLLFVLSIPIVWLRLSRAGLPMAATNWLPVVFSVWLGYMLWMYPLFLFLRALLLSLRVWAWNRRADRLQREGLSVAETVSDEPLAGVWPPPPTIPPPAPKQAR